MLTQERKTELIDIISNALSELIPAESECNSLPEKQPDEDIPVEMLSIKECAAEFKGLSEHSIRLLAARNKIPSFRAGEGVNGKIMIDLGVNLKYISDSLGHTSINITANIYADSLNNAKVLIADKMEEVLL